MNLPTDARAWATANVVVQAAAHWTPLPHKPSWKLASQILAEDTFREYDLHRVQMDNTQLVCASEHTCACSGEAFSWEGRCVKCHAPMIRIDCDSGAHLTKDRERG